MWETAPYLSFNTYSIWRDALLIWICIHLSRRRIRRETGWRKEKDPAQSIQTAKPLWAAQVRPNGCWLISTCAACFVFHLADMFLFFFQSRLTFFLTLMHFEWTVTHQTIYCKHHSFEQVFAMVKRGCLLVLMHFYSIISFSSFFPALFTGSTQWFVATSRDKVTNRTLTRSTMSIEIYTLALTAWRSSSWIWTHNSSNSTMNHINIR